MAEAAERPTKRFVPRGANREAQLLDAALDLLSERGYDAFTIDELTAKAGASKATIYRRWKSKAEIIADAVQRTVRTAERPELSGDLRTDLVAFLTGIGREIVSIPEAARSMLFSTAPDADLATAFDSRFRAPTKAALAAIFLDATERGEMKPGVDTDFVDDLAIPLMLVRSAWGDPLGEDFATTFVDRVLYPLLALSPVDAPSREPAGHDESRTGFRSPAAPTSSPHRRGR